MSLIPRSKKKLCGKLTVGMTDYLQNEFWAQKSPLRVLCPKIISLSCGKLTVGMTDYLQNEFWAQKFPLNSYEIFPLDPTTQAPQNALSLWRQKAEFF
jgi:hypothetical protein